MTWGVCAISEEDLGSCHDYYGHVDPEWAGKWPVEEIWTARKR